jgi:hypothetical protein
MSGASSSAMSSLLGGLPARREGEQQPEAERVSGDRVRACRSLAHQPVAEVRLERGREGAHRGPPKRASSRLAASSISSGTADRYQ